MSNVLMRKRSISDLEFWKNGCEIRAHLTRFLMNEKNVPKRYTFVFTMPGIDLGRKLMEEITAANTIYPTNEDELAQRRLHQTEAVVLCEQIIQHLQWLVDTLQVGNTGGNDQQRSCAAESVAKTKQGFNQQARITHIQVILCK